MIRRGAVGPLAAGLLAALALLLAIACSASPPVTSASVTVPEAPPSPPARLVIGMAPPALVDFDTGAGSSAATHQFLWPVFDGLTWIDDTGAVRPGLAREWSSTDGRTWRFTLRDDVVFTNGERLTAEAVALTVRRLTDLENRLPLSSTFVRIAGVDTPDAQTVVIRLRAPDPTLPRLASMLLILPPRAVTSQGDDAFFRQPSGTGPFSLKEWTPGSGARYVANPAGFVTPRGLPSVPEVVFRWIPESAAQEAALRTGEIDVANGLSPDTARLLESEGWRVTSRRGQTTVHFLLRQDTGPLADARVRRAVNHAVHKENLINNLRRGYAVIDQGQLLGPSVLGYNPELSSFAYDPARARNLLAQAGYAQGFSGSMTVTQNQLGGREIGEAVAANLAAVGVGVEITVQEPAVWVRNFYGTAEQRGEFFVSFLNWEQTYEAGSVYRFFSSDQPPASRRWANERFDQLYQRARSTLDETQRGELYRQAARLLNQEAGALFLWQPSAIAGMRQGVDFDPGLFADRLLRARIGP